MIEKQVIPGGMHGIVWGIVRLADDPWLAGLTDPGMAWEGWEPSQPVLVVASISGEDWAVYCQSPLNKPLMDAVAKLGMKVPEEVGRRLFAFDQLKWRD